MNTIICGGLLLTVCLAVAAALPVSSNEAVKQPVSITAVSEADGLVAEESRWGGRGHHHGGWGHHRGYHGHHGGYNGGYNGGYYSGYYPGYNSGYYGGYYPGYGGWGYGRR